MGVALKTLEMQYGQIKYFSTDSESQLRETKLNPTDAQGNYAFDWTTSLRTGPQIQGHDVIESCVKIFKRFSRKIFGHKFATTRQVTELIIITSCVSINKIPID